jgi:hypothetical protein
MKNFQFNKNQPIDIFNKTFLAAFPCALVVKTSVQNSGKP